MATASKSPEKKAAISGKFMDKKTEKKSPLKKSTLPKESSSKIIKKTAVKVASSNKSVNALIRKSAKKIVVKKSAAVKAVAKKDAAKSKADKVITKSKTPAKNNTEQTKKELGTLPNTIPDTKQAISSSTDPSSATEMVLDTNTSSAPTEIYTTPIAHPDFRSGKTDGYQSKIQAGNKSKSGIKPSGKKPLW